MTTYSPSLLTFSLLFLIGFTCLSIVNTALIILGKYQSNEQLKITHSRRFFFRYILLKFFKKNEWESLHFSISTGKTILALLYVSFAFLSRAMVLSTGPHFLSYLPLFTFCAIIISTAIVVDFIARAFTTISPVKVAGFFLPISSIYLVLLSPLLFVLLKIFTIVLKFTNLKETVNNQFIVKQRIKEILSETRKHLNPYDQKLISSFITFRERVAREIMVPRVDLCAIPTNISIKEAVSIFIEEGYSRIPIYKDTLDHIVGVALHKDILEVYAGKNKGTIDLSSPVEKILKPVIYVPENKKISHLLQEFRTKQTHLAIIVNEYGGTEGIVTIEDVLEELVGEIEDESDVDEDQRYYKLPEGGYVINAKMSIVDIADELNIHIPSHPEYETIGGFVFHKAGTIPQKGWSIHLNEFHLEVLSSDERSIKKILVTPA